MTVEIAPGTKATWRNRDHDEPVTIIGVLGEKNGERFYSVEGTTTGIPEHEIRLNGHTPTIDNIDLDMLDRLSEVNGATAGTACRTEGEAGADSALPPTSNRMNEAVTHDEIASMIDTIAKFDGYMHQVTALDAVKPLIGYLPLDDRYFRSLYDIFKTGKSVDEFLASCPSPPGEPTFKPLGYAEFLAMPPKQWLIDQVIGAGDLMMVYGQPGCGKTFVIIDMIFAACLGKQWAMRFDVVRPLNVAYCAGEGVSGLPERFAAAAEHHTADNLPNFTFYAVTPQLYAGDNANYAESITNFVAEWKDRLNKGQAQPLDVLIIDTMHSATAGADENSAQDMGIVLRLAKEATKELGCAVILVHHTNKNGSAERGSSALRGAMDSMIEVARIGETGTKAKIHCAKLKDGEAWKEQTFDLVESENSVRVWWDEPNDGTEDRRKSGTGPQILKLLAENPDRPLTAKQIADALGIKQQAVNRVTPRLEKDGYATRGQNTKGAWVFKITDDGVIESGVVTDSFLQKNGL